MNNPSLRRCMPLACGLTLLIATTLQTGCVRIPYSRQLPDAIRSVYVPMAQNETAEPGLEEQLTTQMQEELLRDGRLQVRNRGGADMTLHVVVKNWDTRSEAFHNDEFAVSTRVEIKGAAYLYNPEDRLRENPVMSWSEIAYDTTYPSDARFSQATLDVDGKRRVLEGFAREVVLAVLSQATDEAIEREKQKAEGALEAQVSPNPPQL
ncbi:hypothetical protein JXA32_03190 [Candidatus Sumerlaeota bacterium]|nr:hypothetical protein [Candidatus Sumerlaeota bacterium]